MAAKILCNVCNIRRAKTGSKGTEISPHADMCNYCFEEGGMENQHSDRNHDAILAEVADNPGKNLLTFLSVDDFSEYESFMPECWICHPELNLAKLPAKAQTTTTKAQGDRRPQLNHKGHSHPATPAARRACKALFWAHYGTPTAAEFTEWDAKLDGYGKPVAAKPATLTVVPRGPKGGVINQLKAAKPTGGMSSKNAKAAGKFLTKAQGQALYGK